MNTGKIFVILLFLLITVSLLLFEINFDKELSELSVTLRVDWKTKLEIFKSKPEENDICPKTAIAKVDGLGRLGNQIATYANHIALQWEYVKIIFC